MDKLVHHLAQTVIAQFAASGWTLATAESCTGGLIASALTDVPGASAVFTHGFTTYANDAKRDILGVSQRTLDTYGAVSRETALAMADGARRRASANMAVSVTGIAGPGGGSPEKPVGLVYIGVAGPDAVIAHRHLFPASSRGVVRLKTVQAALRHLLAQTPSMPQMA